MVAAWQVRSARAILGWSARELSEASKVSLSTIRRLEEGHMHNVPLLNAVRSTLEQAGVLFVLTSDGKAAIRPKER